MAGTGLSSRPECEASRADASGRWGDECRSKDSWLPVYEMAGGGWMDKSREGRTNIGEEEVEVEIRSDRFP